jgi:NDP-sugar pyrophosphorylase family protein
MKAFILAAGLGTRLRPLTATVPKILVPVLGVPMLDRLAAGLARWGVGQLALNTHHLAEDVQRRVAALEQRGGPPAFRCFHEPELLGTGGALVHIAPFWDSDVLLWNGDVLADADVAGLLAAHRAGGALATLLLSGRAASSRFQVDATGVLCGIDSPRRGDRRLVATPTGAPRSRAYHGIAVLAPALLPRIARPGAFDLVEALLEVAAQGGRIGSYDAGDGFWGTSGSPAELAALEQGLRERPTLLAHFTP